MKSMYLIMGIFLFRKSKHGHSKITISKSNREEAAKIRDGFVALTKEQLASMRPKNVYDYIA